MLSIYAQYDAIWEPLEWLESLPASRFTLGEILVIALAKVASNSDDNPGFSKSEKQGIIDLAVSKGWDMEAWEKRYNERYAPKPKKGKK